MKKFVLFLIVTMTFCMSFAGNEKVMMGTPISLRRHVPIGGATKPSKAPASYFVALSVAYDEINNELNFYDDTDAEVSYYIYNGDGVCVLQGICNFDSEHSFSVSVANMDADDYTIVVLIDNVEYYGIFNIEE